MTAASSSTATQGFATSFVLSHLLPTLQVCTWCETSHSQSTYFCVCCSAAAVVWCCNKNKTALKQILLTCLKIYFVLNKPDLSSAFQNSASSPEGGSTADAALTSSTESDASTLTSSAQTPAEKSERRFKEFLSKHRVLLNDIIRNNPSLLDDTFSPILVTTFPLRFVVADIFTGVSPAHGF